MAVLCLFGGEDGALLGGETGEQSRPFFSPRRRKRVGDSSICLIIFVVSLVGFKRSLSLLFSLFFFPRGS